ncbi:hypothetical protein I4U23_003913 [Adineta vaga]|nr:hypothetical protein I4U23_003913 [Adineta vaga]
MCTFVYNKQVTKVALFVTGVARSWNFLKEEFDRQSNCISEPNVRYYQTLYAGPRLFAVDKEQWHAYKTARGESTYSSVLDFGCDEIIEEVFREKSDKPLVIELDDYIINFDQLVQSLPLVSFTSCTCGNENDWSPFIAQWEGSKLGRACLFNANKCVEKAKDGILTEGSLISKEIEAKQLVKLLDLCETFTIRDTSKYCVHLFTRDNFLYRVVNNALRTNDLIKIDTLGAMLFLRKDGKLGQALHQQVKIDK